MQQEDTQNKIFTVKLDNYIDRGGTGNYFIYQTTMIVREKSIEKAEARCFKNIMDTIIEVNNPSGDHSQYLFYHITNAVPTSQQLNSIYRKSYRDIYESNLKKYLKENLIELEMNGEPQIIT